MAAKPKRSLEEFFATPQRTEFVTAPEAEVVDKGDFFSGGNWQKKPDGKVSTRVHDANITKDIKNNKDTIESTKVLDAELPEAAAPAAAPVQTAPVVPPPVAPPETHGGPYTPMEPQSQEALAKKGGAQVQPAETGSAWERALVGATPLLVGLLTGNKLEGVQTAGNYFVNEESDRYKRGKDFNDKLAQMKAKRDMAGSADGKSTYQKVEAVNPATGKTESWSLLNGKRHEFLGLVNEKAGSAPKAHYDTIVKDGVAYRVEKLPGKEAVPFGQAEPKFRDDIKLTELQEPGNPDPKAAVKVAIINGKEKNYLGKIPESVLRKGGLSLEDHLKKMDHAKELKADELRFKQERELNKDREGVKTTKNTREIAEAHAKIMETSFGKDPVSDVATIFALFKIMDPGSVVRESEQALGVGARSYEDVVNNLNDIALKKRTLTPTQVSNIRKLADKMYKNQLTMQQDSVDSNMVQRAKTYGLNPDFVVPPIKSPYKQAAPVAPKPKTVKQNGVTYTLNEQTGDYE